jgi:hypothetical protein
VHAYNLNNGFLLSVSLCTVENDRLRHVVIIDSGSVSETISRDSTTEFVRPPTKHTMSFPLDTDTIIQQLIQPTVDADAVMAAAAAADAVGSTVEQSTESSTLGERTFAVVSQCVPTEYASL